ncbi:MAG: DUF3084 domain-containing protein [bacterium]|nr:DUF3084 domain-containing protein [bacterium]
MATTSIIFIIVTIAVSGFVAWAGDTLGRVLGKKRVSLFGLRPKKASIVIAVITGMLITALTITAMAFASSTVRKMLLEMDNILNNLTTLQTNLDDLQGNYDELQGSYDNLMIEYGRLAETHSYQISQYEGDIVGFEDKITELNAGKISLEAEITDLTGNISDLNTRYDATKADLESQITDRESRVAELNSQINSLNEQISSLNARLEQIMQELSTHELGNIKVYEGQQLGVVLINTHLDQATIYDLLRGWIDSIPDTYMNPESGELVLKDNQLEVTADDYYTVLQEIRDVGTDRAIVIAFASENVVEQQAVPARFEVSGSRLIYSAGTRIYSNTYDEPEGATDPYRAVSAQFFEDARDYLINQQGFVPSSANQIMQFTIDDLLNLAQQMAETGFPVELKMVALTDIYSTDFLVYGQQFTVEIGNAVPSDLE